MEVATINAEGKDKGRKKLRVKIQGVIVSVPVALATKNADGSYTLPAGQYDVHVCPTQQKRGDAVVNVPSHAFGNSTVAPSNATIVVDTL